MSLEVNADKHSEFKRAYNFYPIQFASNGLLQEESKSAIGLASSVASQLNHEWVDHEGNSKEFEISWQRLDQKNELK